MRGGVTLLASIAFGGVNGKFVSLNTRTTLVGTLPLGTRLFGIDSGTGFTTAVKRVFVLGRGPVVG